MAADEPAVPGQELEGISERKLPTTCSGCGAFAQTTDPKHFGYFDIDSKRVKNWVDPDKRKSKSEATREDSVVDEALSSLDASQIEALGLDRESLLSTESSVQQPAIEDRQPVCDRCHDLMHHGVHAGTAQIPMYHPTVDSLRETIEESPYKYNHIYHIIDAADFPMSLIPRLNVLLGDIPLRSKNRRSRAGKYMRNRQIEMSFIITRSDLLGPTKEKVDSMMPYLREVLRDALGRVGGRIRLGNLRCVSAKRSWWTKTVKEDIWQRGGAGWMVGKVNVGKSQLFEAIYPKGRMTDMDDSRKAQISMYPRETAVTEDNEEEEDPWADYDVESLLPPAQPAKQYPEMPMVSALPGTTASPIRIPFGNGKGELIDLPGLARSDLELFVKPEHRQSLIMKSRIIPEQVSVKTSNSLLLGGGLIRITPRSPNVNFLMYNFTPLKEHLTNTVKATEFQDQSRDSIGVQNISLDGVGAKMKHAGTFQLQHDVTKRRAGPLTRKDAVGLKVDRLPFRVLSVDILIEGVGYVEIVAQVRARDLELLRRPPPRKPTEVPEKTGDVFQDMMNQRRSLDTPVVSPSEPEPEPEPAWPEVDVFSPEGRFIGSRMPIQGWLNNKPLVKPEHKRSRPRKSMRGQKKKEKLEKRAAAAAA